MNHKILNKRVGYIILIVAFMGFMFITEVVEAKQTPFNYTITVRNQSSLVLNSNAACTLTVISTSPAPLIGNDPVDMVNLSNGNTVNGTYGFTINESWTVGDYSTQVSCSEGSLVNSIFDSFSVGLETTDFRDLSIIGSILIIAGLFIFLSFRSEDRLLNPLFFFLSILFIITNFFISSLLTTNSEISSIMLTIYTILILVYTLGVSLYVFVGWFFPFIIKAFVKKKSDDEVAGEI